MTNLLPAPSEPPESPAEGLFEAPKVWSRRHEKRLREIFAKGRPIHLSALSGVELDLIVSGLLEQVDDHRSPSACVKLTPKGVALLGSLRQDRLSAQDVHHSLGARLALYLQTKSKMTWENIVFYHPELRMSGRTWDSVRPDVFACNVSLNADNAHPEIYEVKVSRADFLSDMANPKKGQGYAELAEAVYFCTPQGLVAPEELPPGVGLLWETSPGCFVLKKRAKRQKAFKMHPNTLMTLVIKRGAAITPF